MLQGDSPSSAPIPVSSTTLAPEQAQRLAVKLAKRFPILLEGLEDHERAMLQAPAASWGNLAGSGPGMRGGGGGRRGGKGMPYSPEGGPFGGEHGGYGGGHGQAYTPDYNSLLLTQFNPALASYLQAGVASSYMPGVAEALQSRREKNTSGRPRAANKGFLECNGDGGSCVEGNENDFVPTIRSSVASNPQFGKINCFSGRMVHGLCRELAVSALCGARVGQVGRGATDSP